VQTIHTDSHSTQTDQYSMVNMERHKRPKSTSTDMKSLQSNGGCQRVFSDDKPPPLPVKRSVAAATAQSSFRQRMGGVSEDHGDESMYNSGQILMNMAVFILNYLLNFSFNHEVVLRSILPSQSSRAYTVLYRTWIDSTCG